MTRTERAIIAREAANLIDHGFCRYQVAEDDAGDAVNAEDPNAVCWCVVGAIDRAAFDQGYPELKDAFYWRAPGVVAGLFEYLREVEALNVVPREEFRFRHSCVVTWNNEWAKDGAEVAAMLRAYAETEEGGDAD